MAMGRRKRKSLEKRERQNKEKESLSSGQSDSESDSEAEKKEKRNFRREALARERMIAARPTADQRFGGDNKVNYSNFKQKFLAVTDVKGINYLDVLNEFQNWVTGTAKIFAESYIGSPNPKRAMKKLWDDLDNFYVFRIQSVRELTRELVKNPKVGKDDAEGMMHLAAELASVESEAKRNGIQKDLDNQDLIGEIIESRIPFEAKEFYTEEAKKAVNDRRFTSKYKDLVEYVKLRARVNQSRGNAKTFCKIALLSDDRKH